MESEIEIRKYFRIFWRRKWIAIGSVVSIVAITFLLTQRMEKVYISSAKVLIKKPPIITQGTRIIEEATSMATYLEILRSRDMMKPVAEKLKEAQPSLSIFSSSDPVGALLGHISTRPIRDANIIVITTSDRTPQGAMLMANTVSECFTLESANLAKARIRETKHFIEASLPVAQERLQEYENILKEFKQKHHIISDKTGSSIEGHISKLESERNSLISDIKMKKGTLKALKEELGRQNEALKSSLASVENVSLSTLRGDIVRLSQDKMLYLQAGMSEDHPKIVGIEGRISRIRNEIEEKVIGREGESMLMIDPFEMVSTISRRIIEGRFGLLELETKIAAIEEMLSEYRKKQEEFPDKELELAAIERAYKFNESLYGNLLQRYEEAKLAEISEVGDIVVIEMARLPPGPIFPNVKRNIIFGLIFGLGIGIAGMIIAEYTDTTIREVSDVEKYISTPVIGVVPLYSGEIVSNDMKDKFIIEVYKRIRTNLKFLIVDGNPPKTLLLTSAIEGEGKTIQVANLGIVLAGGGKRVLLVDTDLRKPTLYRLFNIERKPGLTDFLVGDVEMDGVIKSTDIDNLFIIPSGSSPVSPPELLDSERMRKIIEDARSSYDIVIFDSPPVLTCTDAPILSSMVDGVILVVEMKGPRRELVSSARMSLHDVKARVLACILNKASKGDHYGSYHYYYGYGYGYK